MDKSEADNFEVLEIIHEWEIGTGYHARVCKVRMYGHDKLEIRIFRMNIDTNELKASRMKVDFPWSDDGNHTELLGFFVAGLIEAAGKMDVDYTEFI